MEEIEQRAFRWSRLWLLIGGPVNLKPSELKNLLSFPTWAQARDL